ncbi:protein-glutamate O-methyltransferase CheR [Sphingomonas qomolangmaensis]|uniref:Protein-glutamate O-methyltransferase CheR n=2 Tax=Sphingomonas qomolangmaensis TaxID=2918765 RepID=A0ABY5LB68_9SPHN|nr:protein-glutamate O-methyltransferase CheR [Sphingomonas qomolangmaensis]
MEARTGQRIAANRAWRVESALKPLLRARGFESLDELVTALVGDAHRTLADETVEAMLNHESSFFRDPAVIQQVGKLVHDQQASAPGRRLRIWSAGCSTGQEPLSLAMLLTEQNVPGEFPDIVATDVSAGVIARARAGRFTQFEIQRGLPVRSMVRWFEPAGKDWVASPHLLARVQFRRHNLAQDVAPPGLFDVILCRNVLLYLSPAMRSAVLAKLAAALRPDGRLVLGASETVIGQTDALVPCRAYRGFYHRNDKMAASPAPATAVALR